MPVFTAEQQFLVPNYEQLTVWAIVADIDCRKALEANKHRWDAPC